MEETFKEIQCLIIEAIANIETNNDKEYLMKYEMLMNIYRFTRTYNEYKENIEVLTKHEKEKSLRR